MSALNALSDLGQAIWFDSITRGMVRGGELKQMIDQDGLKGMTSNPAIFEKAMTQGTDYQESIARILKTVPVDPKTLYENLAIEDIQGALDLFRPLYDRSAGLHGLVSLEVSPYLALDTEGTLQEGRRLWREVNRPNLMIKVPGTEAGVPAIRELISEGINVNVTLLFSQEMYEKVAWAYIEGLEKLVKSGGNPSRVASVASFFVSRIDSAVDKQLEAKIKSVSDAAEAGRLQALLGKVAIANAKMAYQKYLGIIASARWKALVSKGARTQRLLWASTGTKNPAYRDVVYVEELIGRDTVNTVPPATFVAFKDHGRARETLTERVEDAARTLDELEKADISLSKVTDHLLVDAIQLFSDPFDHLLLSLGKRRREALGDELNGTRIQLTAEQEKEYKKSLEAWRQKGLVRKLWEKDARLWTSQGESRWMDWLEIVDQQWRNRAELQKLAQSIRSEGFEHILLLGMGGSSLCPFVLNATFGLAQGFPKFHVLDSTDPAQVSSVEKEISYGSTLFVVSSKSGTTLEPNILMEYFLGRARAEQGESEASRYFIAITDPGSKLESFSREAKFRAVFPGVPGIGGRYSALSDFGLVPAALIGVDVERFLFRALQMVRSCSAFSLPEENPGVQLGAALGTLALHGRDKVTLLCSPELSSFGAWVEQLLAESTGKNGKALIPIDQELLAPASSYGSDRVFVCVKLSADQAFDSRLKALQELGHPVITLSMQDRYGLGQEFFRWEIATAVTGAILGINPFDQPDVEASKVETRRLTDEYGKKGGLPRETAFFSDERFDLYADPENQKRLLGALGSPSVRTYIEALFAQLRPRDYFAILAYLPMFPQHERELNDLRGVIRDSKRVATCLGFGPRFLHSTGQAYKGGPDTGVFLQLTCDDEQDLKVPGHPYSFGVVKAAQARGDFQVLASRGRRALRIHLKGKVSNSLSTLATIVQNILGEKK